MGWGAEQIFKQVARAVQQLPGTLAAVQQHVARVSMCSDSEQCLGLTYM
jgi:hypothetical protein